MPGEATRPAGRRSRRCAAWLQVPRGYSFLEDKDSAGVGLRAGCTKVAAPLRRSAECGAWNLPRRALAPRDGQFVRCEDCTASWNRALSAAAMSPPGLTSKYRPEVAQACIAGATCGSFGITLATDHGSDSGR
jgi:hypothetical protein